MNDFAPVVPFAPHADHRLMLSTLESFKWTVKWGEGALVVQENISAEPAIESLYCEDCQLVLEAPEIVWAF